MLSGNSDFEKNLLIEHVSDATVFKEFRFGIKKMDDFIHEGLDLSVKNNFCKLYKVSRDEEIVALFALSFDSLILDYEDKTELKQTESVGVDSRYEEVFWSKRHYPALEIAYLAVREDLRGSDIGSFLINSIAEMAAGQKLAGCQFLTVEALSKAKEKEQDYSATAFYYKNHFESCELPNSTKDTMRMYRPLYMN
jgi:GNAT superfamily N-acetyltransferase